MKKLLVLAVTSILLSGCGFTPVHAPIGGQKAAFKDIKIELIETEVALNNKSGFFILQRLRDRIGVSGQAYTLKLTPKFGAGGFGVNTADVATRYDYSIVTQYVLIDTKSGETLTSGKVSGVSTFAASRDPYGKEITAASAMQAVAADNADRILTKLAVYFAKSP